MNPKEFISLNLPSLNPTLKQEEGKLYILCLIRKKYMLLTPEEWVRQHFIHLLILKDYPKSLISVESGLKYNRLKKRSDIVVYDRVGQPFLLVECKAPTVKLSDQTFKQAATYNATLKAPFLGITNGLMHFFSAINFETKQYDFLNDIPEFPEK